MTETEETEAVVAAEVNHHSIDLEMTETIEVLEAETEDATISLEVIEIENLQAQADKDKEAINQEVIKERNL